MITILKDHVSLEISAMQVHKYIKYILKEL